MQMQENFAGN